jgi:glycosyltransferase involved in cell wall biosynthesis
VGRLEQQKNRRLLIEAYSDVYKNHPEYTLDIYGEGSQENELKKLISELKLDNSIILHGNVNDVHRKIADAEIFVLSSDYEGLSNALIEAMMMGFPCISTDCAGAIDIIENGVDGFIIPIRNRQQMVERINELIETPSLREEFSKKSAEHSKKFNVENVIVQWERLLTE